MKYAVNCFTGLFIIGLLALARHDPQRRGRGGDEHAVSVAQLA